VYTAYSLLHVIGISSVHVSALSYLEYFDGIGWTTGTTCFSHSQRLCFREHEEGLINKIGK